VGGETREIPCHQGVLVKMIGFLLGFLADARVFCPMLSLADDGEAERLQLLTLQDDDGFCAPAVGLTQSSILAFVLLNAKGPSLPAWPKDRAVNIIRWDKVNLIAVVVCLGPRVPVTDKLACTDQGDSA
jgi:hypothetical protein